MGAGEKGGGRSATVQIGRRPVQRCKSGTRLQSTEYRGQRAKGTRVWLARVATERCKSAYGLCKGAKLDTKQVGAWQDRLQSTDYRLRRKGRGVALPRPPMVEDKAKPCPYPRAEPARGMLGQHAVPTLPKATRVARGAVPTRYKVKRGTGGRKEACLLTLCSVLRTL